MKIRKERIPSAGPSISSTEIDLVSEAIKTGWGNKMNFYIESFVEEFSDYTGLSYCLPTAHCTDAIHLSMLVSDIGPGDEVIVPDLTWVASAAPITYVGATPVFVDVDKTNLCICPDSFEQAISKNTKAVVIVDLLGNLPDWDKIRSIANKYKLIVIEDAAEGLGATYKGRPAGSFGDISLFSFSPTKLIMAGQGGMFCSNNVDLFERAKLLSHHGINKQPGHEYFWSTEVGYNYSWTNIQASLALAQLRRIDELIDYKKWLFNLYQSNLMGIEGVSINQNYKNVHPTFWITFAILKKEFVLTKQELVKSFDQYNIDLRPMFYPISSMPPFKKYLSHKVTKEINPNSYSISKYGICLPNGNNLSESDVIYICDVLKEILQKRRN